LEESPVRFCTQCGKKNNDPNNAFCVYCGAKFESAAPKREAAATKGEAAATQREAAATKGEAAATQREAAVPQQREREAAVPQKEAVDPQKEATAPKRQAALPKQRAEVKTPAKPVHAQKQNALPNKPAARRKNRFGLVAVLAVLVLVFAGAAAVCVYAFINGVEALPTGGQYVPTTGG